MKRAWAVAAFLLVPFAVAHGAPDPRGHETRLLADCNDDYFGGDLNSGRTGYDLHALDVREAWDPSLGDVVILRLILNGAGASDIEVSFTSPSGPFSAGWSTSGGGWTAQGFDRMAGPMAKFWR